MERYDDALKLLDKAIGTNASDAEANLWFFFQRAQGILFLIAVLFKLERYQEALDQLNDIKGIAGEPSVYFLMGKIYKKLGLVSEAVDSFANAQDSSGTQRVAALIKDAMEKVDDGLDVVGNEGFRVLFE